MSDALENAKRRLAVLLNETKRVQQFIEMYETFSALDALHDEQTAHIESERVSSAHRPPEAVEKISRRRRSGPAPKQIVEMAERFILEAGRPLTRGEIAAMFETRDVELPGEDKPRYVGTIMWRNKAKFVNVDGRGYWLRGEPMPNQSPQRQDDREKLSRIEGRLAYIRNQIDRTGENPVSDYDYQVMVEDRRRLKDLLDL